METHRYIDGRRKITRSSLGIKKYTINGTFVTYWSTPLEAAKAYGIRAHDISRCLKGEKAYCRWKNIPSFIRSNIKKT